MSYIIVFSLTIALFTYTHSVGIFCIWIAVIFVMSYYSLWKFTREKILTYAMILCCSVLSVVIYDYRMSGSFTGLVSLYQGLPGQRILSGEEEFVVQHAQRMNRYVIQDRTSSDQEFLLYTTQSLRPGDVVTTKSQPIWRKYTPELCILLCRQSRQVLDNEGFDYDRWLYMQGLDGSFYDNHVFVSAHIPLVGLDSIRDSFFQTVVERFGKNNIAGLMLGMTIGDKSLIDDARYDQYISSGLIHLIAVSGGNIAIVVLFLGMILFRLPFYMRQIVLIIAIISYAMIVGSDSSVIRAAVMGLLTLLVLFPGRQLSIWRNLMYARCGMLLWNPYYLLYDMGFILSFSAVIGIIRAEKRIVVFNLIQPLQKEEIVKKTHDKTQGGYRTTDMLHLFKRWYRQLLSLYIVPTIGAMVGVTPWLLLSMGQINLFSPIVNIMIVPFVPLITIGSFIVPYLPRWGGGDYIITYAIHYIEWLSTIGTKYGVYVSLSVGVKYIVLSVMLIYRVWWIEKEK